MSGIKRAILFYALLPLNVLVAWPMAIAVRLLWGRDLRWTRWVLSSEFKPDSWPLRAGTWPKGFYLRNRKAILEARVKGEEPPSPNPWNGTSIGEGQIYGPGIRTAAGTPFYEWTRTQYHEWRHVRQARAVQVAVCFEAHVLAVILVIAGSPWLALILGLLLWTLGGNVAVVVGGLVAAKLESDPRGPYRGSAHEIDAYDTAALWVSMTPEQRRRRIEGP